MDASLKAERYGKEVPLLLRLLGCWGIQGRSYRFWWGECNPTFGFALQYGVYHESASLRIQLLWGALYIKAPMLVKQRPGTEDWCATYGFTFFDRSIHLNWRDSTKVLYMPWDWQHVRHTYLRPDGSVHHHEERRRGVFERPPEETKQVWPYMYRRRNGDVQIVDATINGEEREWRWRWFTWSPWPRRIQRSVNVDFSGQIGEGVDTWKGGTLGCGWEWRHGETMLSALRRMEHERKFER